jgi:hypothetical protein
VRYGGGKTPKLQNGKGEPEPGNRIEISTGIKTLKEKAQECCQGEINLTGSER